MMHTEVVTFLDMKVTYTMQYIIRGKAQIRIQYMYTAKIILIINIFVNVSENKSLMLTKAAFHW